MLQLAACTNDNWHHVPINDTLGELQDAGIVTDDDQYMIFEASIASVCFG